MSRRGQEILYLRKGEWRREGGREGGPWKDSRDVVGMERSERR